MASKLPCRQWQKGGVDRLQVLWEVRCCTWIASPSFPAGTHTGFGDALVQSSASCSTSSLLLQCLADICLWYGNGMVLFFVHFRFGAFFSDSIFVCFCLCFCFFSYFFASLPLCFSTSLFRLSLVRFSAPLLLLSCFAFLPFPALFLLLRFSLSDRKTLKQLLESLNQSDLH